MTANKRLMNQYFQRAREMYFCVYDGSGIHVISALSCKQRETAKKTETLHIWRMSKSCFLWRCRYRRNTYWPGLLALLGAIFYPHWPLFSSRRVVKAVKLSPKDKLYNFYWRQIFIFTFFLHLYDNFYSP